MKPLDPTIQPALNPPVCTSGPFTDFLLIPKTQSRLGLKLPEIKTPVSKIFRLSKFLEKKTEGEADLACSL